MTLDTLSYAKKLEAAGVDRRHAEAIAEGLNEAITSHFASKADLDNAVARLEARIDRVENRIDMKIAELRAEVFRLMMGQIVVFAGLVFAIVRLFGPVAR